MSEIIKIILSFLIGYALGMIITSAMGRNLVKDEGKKK
jgi:hypothetical protein